MAVLLTVRGERSHVTANLDVAVGVALRANDHSRCRAVEHQVDRRYRS